MLIPYLLHVRRIPLKDKGRIIRAILAQFFLSGLVIIEHLNASRIRFWVR